MKVLLTGAHGQVGSELLRNAPGGVEIHGCDADTLDVTDPTAVDNFVAHVCPTLILNCAAYTAVDKAESHESAAFAVNSEGAANLARAASGVGARMVHYSTDFVFDGCQQVPYQPEDQPNPLSVYGRSKLHGEREVLKILGERGLVIRTSWVFSVHGQNFVKSVIRLMREREDIRIVADQVGVPTYAGDLASATWALVSDETRCGVWHLTNSGMASWYDFAVATRDEAVLMGLLPDRTSVQPITASEYPTPAARPPYSVMDANASWIALGAPLPHWRKSLTTMLIELRDRDDA